jgi:glycosyltransferase involved in cell wall biosynthesis
MKVLILSDHYLPGIGGAEFATHSLADALSRRGHAVMVMAPALADRSREVRARYGIVRYFYPRFVSPSLIKAFGLLRQQALAGIDVVHAQLLYPAGYQAVLYRRLSKTPLVISPQGADIHTYAPLNYGLLLRPEYRKRIVQALKYADALTYSSDLMRDALEELGYGARHCSYLPNGTVLARFDPSVRASVRERLGLDRATTVFVTVSRHSPIKGLPLLLEALTRLRDEAIPWHSIIAGSNVHLLEESVRELGLAERVTLISNLPIEYDADGIPVSPSAEIADLLVASDVYVAPALSGGFELSSADALAAGLPTVIADENGSRDIVERCDAGIVFRTGDVEGLAGAMRRLLCQEETRARMRRNALDAAVRLDWDAIAGETESIYERVISDRRKI